MAAQISKFCGCALLILSTVLLECSTPHQNLFGPDLSNLAGPSCCEVCGWPGRIREEGFETHQSSLQIFPKPLLL